MYGNFQSFDSPFAAQSEALAINDFGVTSGINTNENGFLVYICEVSQVVP